MKTSILSILWFLLSYPVFAGDTISLSPGNKEYVLAGKKIDVYEDKSGSLTLAKLLAPELQKEFKTYEKEGIYSSEKKSAYWIRFTVSNPEDYLFDPVLEFYDIKTDNIQLYIPDGNTYQKKESGDLFPFRTREYQHINFVFDLNKIPKGNTTYYLRLKSNHTIYLYAVLRSHQRFVEYATQEYFLLTIFYGIILAMLSYNLFLFISLKDRVYLYYLLYVLSIGFYSLDRDGMGNQFVWPDFPGWNIYMEELSLTCLVVFALMYAKKFINTREFIPFLDKIINATIVFRITYFLLWLLFDYKFINGIYLDIFVLFVPYLSGFISFQKGFVPSRYYLLGYTMLFLGLLVTSMESLTIIPGSVWTFYSMHIGVVFQMLILTFALADKVRVLMKENDLAQKRIIEELTEKEILKDKVNKELEQKVEERTKELKYRIEQLDNFVYRASHDIKGPLRSLMGLSMLGVKESKEERIHEYFQHSHKTSMRLDKILGTLLNMTKSRQTALHFVPIDFGTIINEIIYTFRLQEEFKNLKIDTSISTSEIFHADEYLVYSILQNLTDNALKFQTGTDRSFLNISITANEKGASIVFADNGRGIKKEHLHRIFDMFIRTDETSKGSGLGLFIVKQYLERLKGTVHVESEYGKGTTFTIFIPNQK